ncbi:MAG: hypothetical protein JNL94_09365 [Planctomycetes bacterium]|nr:hypothetical protein [Planctomycetota bacterium]
MSSNRWFLAAAALIASSSVVFALQQPSRPGVVGATTSLAVDAETGGKVEITYKTMPFGPKTYENVKANPDMAARWEQMLPRMLGAKFHTDAALKIGDKDIAAGDYDVSFTLTGEAGVQLKLLPKEGEAHVIALRPNTGAPATKFLNLNLMSTGGGEFSLAIGYGSEQLVVDGKVAPKTGG